MSRDDADWWTLAAAVEAWLPGGRLVDEAGAQVAALAAGVASREQGTLRDAAEALRRAAAEPAGGFDALDAAIDAVREADALRAARAALLSARRALGRADPRGDALDRIVAALARA
jgi:hypothetical protein